MSKLSRLNDKFRITFVGGHVTVTDGVVALPRSTQHAIKKAVRRFSKFEDRDHEFGTFDIEGQKVFWRIEYFDRTFRKPSPDPASARKTIRILRIGLMSEEQR